MPLVLRAKCIVVGNSTVGKTALVQACQSGGTQFPKNYNMTTGVDISVKSMRIPGTQDSVELYIYDSAGKELYSEFVQNFWDAPSIVIVVYDVTDTESFQSCAKWHERVRAQKSSPDMKLPGILVANKVDLVQRRTVTEEEGKSLAASRELEYFECSAKEQTNLAIQPFQFIAETFYANYKEKAEQLQMLTLQ